MKISHVFILALISTFVTIMACKDNPDASTTQEQPASPQGTVATDPAAANATAVGNEPHYKCTKPDCKGSAAAQGKCPICNSDLAHNQAFHAQAGAVGASPANPVQIDPKTGQPVSGGQSTPPPAQNAKGEYHYTCAKGHPGAATAGNCSTCGEPLAHNQAYHQ